MSLVFISLISVLCGINQSEVTDAAENVALLLHDDILNIYSVCGRVRSTDRLFCIYYIILVVL